uniref:Uncharacterized protein n=1 Tax=Arundo donax TaxID=35708 RepID=A0A0A8ZL59_ARUDO
MKRAQLQRGILNLGDPALLSHVHTDLHPCLGRLLSHLARLLCLRPHWPKTPQQANS